MTVYYVNKSGNDGNDGLSHGTAWLTIFHAVTTALAGDLVKIGSGVYHECLGEHFANAPSLEGDGYVVIDVGNLNASFIYRPFNDTVTIKNLVFKGSALSFGALQVGVNSIVEDCIFEINSYGIYNMHTNMRIRRNIFLNCGGGLRGWGDSQKIINNTFIGCNYGIYMGTAIYNLEKFYNNIFKDIKICALLWNRTGAPNMDYNCFHNCAKIAVHAGTDYDTLVAWQAIADQNSIEADPQFVSVPDDLYGLKITSPCIIAGENGVSQGAEFTCPISATGSGLSTWHADPNVLWESTRNFWYLDSGLSGKLTSPVFDFGSVRRIGQFINVGGEEYPYDVLDADNADTKPNRRQTEFRYSDSLFLWDDESPSWQNIERYDKLNIYARYVQFRETLRIDGVAA